MATFVKDIIGYGLFGDRPTAGGEGRLYYATDTSLLYRDNGSTWDTLAFGGGGGSGGALIEIDAQTLSASAASVTFSAVPDSYRALLVQWMVRGDGGLCELGVRLNGDTAANYDYLELYAGTSGVAQNHASAQTYARMGIVPGPSDIAAGIFNYGRFLIPFYANTSAQKALHGASARKDDNTTFYNNVQEAWWRTTGAAVSSITLLPSSGNLVSGSQFALYGLS